MRCITKFLTCLFCIYASLCSAQHNADTALKEALKAKGLRIDSFIHISNIDSLFNSGLDNNFVPKQNLCYLHPANLNWTYIIYTGTDSVIVNGNAITYINPHTSAFLFRNDSSLLIVFPYSSNYFLGNTNFPMLKLITFSDIPHLYVFKHGQKIADIVLVKNSFKHKFNDELHIKTSNKKKVITIPKEVFSYFKSTQNFNSDKFLQDFDMFFTLYKSYL